MEQHLGVRYRYAEESRETPAKPTMTTLCAEDLTRLPQDLLKSLWDAVIELDQEKVEVAIVAIHEQEPVLADSIHTLAEQYRYERLMDLCEEAYEYIQRGKP